MAFVGKSWKASNFRTRRLSAIDDKAPPTLIHRGKFRASFADMGKLVRLSKPNKKMPRKSGALIFAQGLRLLQPAD
jgi:hypothetical protein